MITDNIIKLSDNTIFRDVYIMANMTSLMSFSAHTHRWQVVQPYKITWQNENFRFTQRNGTSINRPFCCSLWGLFSGRQQQKMLLWKSLSEEILFQQRIRH